MKTVKGSGKYNIHTIAIILFIIIGMFRIRMYIDGKRKSGIYRINKKF